MTFCYSDCGECGDEEEKWALGEETKTKSKHRKKRRSFPEMLRAESGKKLARSPENENPIPLSERAHAALVRRH